MDQLSFQYPTWYLLLCILLGFVYALVLYFRDTTYRDQPRWLTAFMSSLRFLGITLLSALLLSPLLKLNSDEVQSPIVVVAQDLSQSAVQSMSSADSTNYTASFKQLINDLEEKYEVYQVGFGSEITDSIDWQFDDDVTDLDQALNYISDNFGDQNLGAVVLASDGIYNRGRNPIYSGAQIKSPIYTVGLGDTTERTDLVVKHVFHNKIAFLGDRFAVQVDVTARNLQGKSATLTLEKIEGSGGRVQLDRTAVRIVENEFFSTHEFILDAEKPGVQRYRLRLTGMPDEVTYANNVKDIFVEIIDGRQNILVLGASPHPDLAAIKSSLELNENYAVTTALISDFTEDLSNYNLVVLHQLPGRLQSASNALSKLNSLKTPRLFVLGNQSDVNQFNLSQGLMTIRGGNRSGNEVQALMDPTFNLFTFSDELKNEFPRFAPASAPYGQYEYSPAGQVLAFQKIGAVDTKYPLIMMGEENGIKTGIISAEGIWKWRLYDYLQNENHERLNELISKSVQYLTIKEDKRKFRSGPNKNLFMDNEEIVFDAELYNNSYELINTPDVFLVIRNEEGNEFDYSFNRVGNTYQINVGKYPDGSYRYTAYVDYDGQRQTVNGRFAVQPIQLESFETVADHQVLRQISSAQNGVHYQPNQLTDLTAQILNDEQIKPILYQKVQTRSVIHLKWIFAVLLFLICLEWFFRRYFGGY